MDMIGEIPSGDRVAATVVFWDVFSMTLALHDHERCRRAYRLVFLSQSCRCSLREELMAFDGEVLRL